MFNKKVEEYEKKNLKPDYYVILRNCCFLALFWDLAFTTLLTFIAESLAVFYSYYIGQMLNYINSPNPSINGGIEVVFVFYGT